MDNDILIRLSAQDDLSPVLKNLGAAFDLFTEKYEKARDEMATTGGVEASWEALARVVKTQTGNIIKDLEKQGDAQEALAGRLLQQQERVNAEADRLQQQAIDKQSRADAERLAEMARIAEREKAIYLQVQESKRVAAEKAATREIEIFLQVQEHQRKILEENAALMEKHGRDPQRREAEIAVIKRLADADKVRNDARIAQERTFAQNATNTAKQIAEGQRLIAEHGRDPQRAAVEQTVIKQLAAEQDVAHKRVTWLDQYAQHTRMFREADLSATRIQENAERSLGETRTAQLHKASRELGDFDARLAKASAGGGMGATMGQIGRGVGRGLSAVGHVTGEVGKFAWQGMETGINAIGGAVKGITGLFGSMANAVQHAGGEIGQFVRIGLSIYTVHEVVQLLERSIVGLGEGILSFQDKMIQVQSLTVHGTEGFEMMKEGILDLSMTTGRSAKELGDALFFIESHGYKGADAINILTLAAKQSASGLGETNDIIRIVTGQMIAYGAGAEEASRYFDVFAQTERLASLTIGDLSDQMQRITPVTAALGIDVEQVGAAIATISQTGLPAGRVVTDLGAALQSLVKLTPQAKETLDAMGLSADSLRKTLQEKGLFAGLHEIWERSGHDVEAVSRVFGDGARALVGYLALMEQNGERYAENLRMMYEASGATEAIWRKNQERLSVQLDRSAAIWQAYGIALTESMVPAISGWLQGVNDAFQKGDITRGVDLVVQGIQQGSDAILGAIADLTGQMFGAGGTLIVEFARGIVEAANAVITQAANYVADMIASFLLGSSPPPKGPLHAINQGVMAWNKEYATAMLEGGMALSGTAERVAGTVNEQLAKIGTVGAAGTRKGIEGQIAALDQLLLPWQMAADQIKESYQAMLDPLERQIEIIKNIKDLEYERRSLVFERQDMELMGLKIRSEGDPAKRAQLVGQLEAARLRGSAIDIDQQLASLRRRQGELGKSKMSAQERALEGKSIANAIEQLEIRKKIFGLTDQTAAVQYAAGKEKLDADKAEADLAHKAFLVAQKEALYPLEQQHDLIKSQMNAELSYIKLQTDAYEDQKRMLQSILKMMPPDKAGGAGGAGGAAGGWKLPEPPKLPTREGIEKATVDLMVKSLRTRIETGIAEFMQSDTFQSVGLTLAGGLIGGMIGGLPLAIVGAAFAPRLAEALEARGVTDLDFTKFVNNVLTDLRDTFGRATTKLSAGDILGTVGELSASITRWVDEFQTAFFKEWYVSRTPGVKGDPTKDVQSTLKDYSGSAAGQRFIEENIGGIGSQRYVGLGRAIVEGIRGRIIEEPLDFKALDEAIGGVFKAIAAHLTTPTVTEAGGGMPMLGPSVLDTAFAQIGDSIVAWVKGAQQKIVAATPGAGAEAQKLGEALGGAIFGEMALEFDQPHDNIIAAATRLGVRVGAAFAEGFAKKIPVIGGIVSFAEWLNTIQVGGQLEPEWLKTQQEYQADPEGFMKKHNLPPPPKATPTPPTGYVPPLNVIQPPTATPTPGPDLLPALPKSAIQESPWRGGFDEQGVWKTVNEGYIEVGKAAAEGFTTGLSEVADETQQKVAGYAQTNFVDPVNTVLDINTPSRVYKQMGEDCLEGFQNAFQEDGTTGAILRMWATSEVISQARSILVTGVTTAGAGGGRGGLAGVAEEALSGMAGVFESAPDGRMVSALNTLGNRIVTELMAPIKGPNGLMAQVQAILDAIARLRVRLPTVEQPGTGAGGDSNAGGGTGDTPGRADERGGGRQAASSLEYGTNMGALWDIPAANTTNTGGDVNINSPLITVASMNGDSDDLDNMLDRVRQFIIDDVRVARGQGVTRPGGVSPRGSR